MVHCEVCGIQLAYSIEGYKAHLKRIHGANPSKALQQALESKATGLVGTRKIVPERFTNRTKAQIVHDMEKTWGSAVYPPVKPWDSL